MKKGFSMMQLWVFLLIVILFIVLYTSFSQKIYEKVRDTDAICVASVRANSLMQYIGVDAFKKELRCETNKVDVDLSGEYARRSIAEELRYCWDKFGQGKATLFKGNDLYCSLCSVIHAEGNEKIDDFDAYLKNTNIPRKRISYAAYLQGLETEDAATELLEFPEQTGGTITEGDYAVLFMYAKGADFLTKASPLLHLIYEPGLAYMLITGTSPFEVARRAKTRFDKAARQHSALTLLMPYKEEELKKLGCRYIKFK